MISVIPTCDDVLCGRGAVPFQHPGNKKLREKIAENLDAYKSCQNRQGKTNIIRDTIRYVIVEEGGRFLKEGIDGKWYDAGMKAAKSRVSTAYRDALVPNKVKCMEALKKKQSIQRIDDENTLVAMHPSNFVQRRTSLSSLSSAIIQLFRVDDKPDRTQPRRESMNSSSTFASLLLSPSSSTEEDSLNSSISTLDSCLMTGLTMPCQASSLPNIEHKQAPTSNATDAILNDEDYIWANKKTDYSSFPKEDYFDSAHSLFADLERKRSNLPFSRGLERENSLGNILGKSISFIALTTS